MKKTETIKAIKNDPKRIKSAIAAMRKVAKIDGPLHFPSEDIIQSIEKVLDYLDADEARHYEECTEEEKENHIFLDIIFLRLYLEMVKKWSKNTGPKSPVIVVRTNSEDEAEKA